MLHFPRPGQGTPRGQLTGWGGAIGLVLVVAAHRLLLKDWQLRCLTLMAVLWLLQHLRESETVHQS